MNQPDLSHFSMLELFRMEVETQVTVLNDHLLALENQSGSSEEPAIAQRLEHLMRGAHSIKGAARIVNVEPAVRLAHVMEDCFVAAQKGAVVLDSAAVDVLLRGVDWWIELSHQTEPELPPWLAQQEAGLGELVGAIAALSTAATPASPPPTSPAEPQSPAPIATPSTSAAHTERVIRVNADRLNQLMALAGESLVEANWLLPFTDALGQLKQQQQQLSRLLESLEASLQPALSRSPASQQQFSQARQTAQNCQRLLGERLGELDQFSQRFTQLSENLYREVIASHMRPFADGIQGFPRLVRDLAKQLGKQVQLEIVGANTPVDRDILEKLEAPLTQMLRNAIVHGIAPPPERQAQGKPAIGTIRLEASHCAGMLSITVSDDGQGIELEHLRQAVVQKQLVAAALVHQLTAAELLEFLFLPGFSTADRVTEVAGRGVGLDIAKSMAQEVGGLLRVSTHPGQGLSFQFQLPLTLSVIRALLVEIAGEPYALGLARIDQVQMVSPEAIALNENHPYIVINEENISLVKAQQVLELPELNPEAPPELLPVVILSDNTHRYGMIVDRFLGEQDLVVRALDPRLGKVQDISAAAVTESGEPLLIIDVADLVRSIDQLISAGRLHELDHPASVQPTPQQKRVLVVDDSISVREMERKLLQNQGYQVDVAVNGMEGWNAVRLGNYDLLISDVDMPRMNGIELVQQVKQHPQLKSLPVIIVSYKDRQADRIAGLEAGADYYLTKSSFHDNSLLKAVADLIG
ncbi:MAG: hybrid sensor histidine kinase/response regulator [Spirulina sp. SIO3F2]|nr:hybrid sensor histidine kinase/response regulator [Spirulina sp. SIO3F2]